MGQRQAPLLVQLRAINQEEVGSQEEVQQPPRGRRMLKVPRSGQRRQKRDRVGRKEVTSEGAEEGVRMGRRAQRWGRVQPGGLEAVAQWLRLRLPPSPPMPSRKAETQMVEKEKKARHSALFMLIGFCMSDVLLGLVHIQVPISRLLYNKVSFF